MTTLKRFIISLSGCSCSALAFRKNEEGGSGVKQIKYLFAADAVFGKLLVMAGAAVNVISFGEETLRSYWSFTAATGETLVMPRVPFVLHALCACRG